MSNGSGTRELSPRERELLARLLAADFPGVKELRQQATSVVGRSCDCGKCASVHLVVKRDAAAPLSVAPGQVPSRAELPPTTEHAGGGLVLNVEDGYLSYLEVYSYAAPLTELPAVDALIWVVDS